MNKICAGEAPQETQVKNRKNCKRLRGKGPEEKAKGQSSILDGKQVFQAVYFDTPFNQIVEEAAEWK